MKDTPDTLLNILDECKKAGKPNMVYIFGSTSKITFAGAGVAVMGASEENINHIKKIMSMQTIGHDKMNQLRHLKFFGTYENMLEHMKKHRQIIEPKFNKVLEALEKEIAPLAG